MARPRIFVSSTYYDLKHVRSSLDNFIESLGFDSVLSEKSDIAYSPDISLGESCCREATIADMFVLIIGGRYGSPASKEDKSPPQKFFDLYDSITKMEYESAANREIPTYILIESNVYSEYQTFLQNKNNKTIRYAHVDSVNIFNLIEEILAKPRNNPISTFERFSDIESWLREQWAGLFRELLNRISSQQQMATLSAQVEKLEVNNETLRYYLEEVVTKVSPDDAPKLIEKQHTRLSKLKQIEEIKKVPFFRTLSIKENMLPEPFIKALDTANTFTEFAEQLGKTFPKH
jgi:hypothetical protein